MVQELGADEVVDYQKENFAEIYKDKPFDLILDSVGGVPHALQTVQCLAVLSNRGSVATPWIIFAGQILTSIH